MDGFERRREQKKKDILNAALDLFIDFGVQKVSIAEIAKKANVSQVTIYNYFESKDNLIRMATRAYVDQIWEKLKHQLTSDSPFEDKIKQMISIKGVSNNTANDKFLQELMKDYAASGSYVQEVYLKEGLPLLMNFIDDGKEKGYIDSSISNEAILVYLQMFQAYMQREDIISDLLPLSEDLTRLFFYGIIGNKNSKE